MKTLPINRLHDLFHCDPDAGKLVWRERPLGDFATVRAHTCFMSRYCGREAGSISGLGYRIIVIDRVNYLAHRLIWAYVHGEWPDGLIDHKNGIRDDNRIANLRIVDHSENARNSKRWSTNTSGVTGVSWNSSKRRWIATVRIRGKVIHVAQTVSKDEAVAARLAAAASHGFHANHGRIE